MGAIPYTPTHDGEIVLQKGHVFDNVTTYREVLRDYAVKGGYVLNWIKNESNRVTVSYKGEGCKWRLHASILAD